MRIKWVRNAAVVVFAALLCRLGYLSLVQGEELASQAVFQRVDKVVVQNTRGIIYDRSMRKITDAQTEAAQVDGVGPLYVSKRYHQGLLSHVVGYLTADGGGFGIEKAFDELLKDNQPATVAVVRDANQRAIPGVQPGMSSGRVYQGIQLTIDYHIQKLTEQAMDREKIKGAAIVVDAKSGDILAMASRPNFNQNQIASYLDSDGGELINRALTAYDVGSVFKILVSAAALESGSSHEIPFPCTGSMDVDGLEFVCGREEGHGTLTMPQGLALSCNCVYYQLGLEMGLEPISRYARAFGFGQPVLNIRGMSEASGNIPSSPNATRREIANVSIGQGNVQVTPLQVADMVCTIVNGGERKQLTLIKSLIGEDGTGVPVKPVTLGRVVAADTARIIKSMLVQGVEYGTGTGANIPGWGAGGKTGSAQTGWEVDGHTMTHGWFAGFFPADDPQYVCVVLAEDGKTGGGSAVPVFRAIGEGIQQLF